MEELFREFARHTPHQHIYREHEYVCKFCQEGIPQLTIKKEEECQHRHIRLDNCHPQMGYACCICLECGSDWREGNLPKISF